MTALSNEEVNAISCIPGAMFANAGCTSTSTARLKEPRKTTIKAPESVTQGVFVRNDYVVLLKGDHVTARLLAQIVYWYQVAESGKPKLKKQWDDKFWIAKTAAEWETEISLTRRQVDRSKSILEAMGIISTHSSGFAGDRSTYYRLNMAAGANHLKEVPPAYALVGAYGDSAPYAPVGAFISTHECIHKHLQVHSNTRDYIQETTNKKLKTYKSAVPAEVLQAVEKTEVLQAKSTTPEPTPVALEPIPDTFLVHYKRMAKTHDMENLLKVCIDAGFVPKGRAMLSDPECSILERIEIENTCDGSLEDLLTTLGTPEAWETFIFLVLDENLDASTPSTPNLAFLKKHLHLFLGTEKKETPPPAPIEIAAAETVQAATPPAPIEMAASASVTSQAGADLVVVPMKTPPLAPKKPHPVKPKAPPVPMLDQVKKHQAEQDAAAKLAAEAARKAKADAAFGAGWLVGKTP
jgi:hypothetical protein